MFIYGSFRHSPYGNTLNIRWPNPRPSNLGGVLHLLRRLCEAAKIHRGLARLPESQWTSRRNMETPCYPLVNK